MKTARTLRGIAVGAALGFLLGAVIFAQHAATLEQPQATAKPTLSTSQMQVKTLVEEHHCWNGPAPADMEGKTPGHVVVTVDGDVVYGGPVLVEKALNQVFAGIDAGLTVWGFCR